MKLYPCIYHPENRQWYAHILYYFPDISETLILFIFKEDLKSIDELKLKPLLFTSYDSNNFIKLNRDMFNHITIIDTLGRVEDINEIIKTYNKT